MKIFAFLLFLIYSAGVFMIGRMSHDSFNGTFNLRTKSVRFVDRLITTADGSTIVENIVENTETIEPKTPARSFSLIPNYNLRTKSTNIAFEYAEFSRLPLIGEFETGVFVNIDAKNGTVENVGLSATKRF